MIRPPGSDAPMDSTELREILARCGWSQRLAGELVPAIGERRMREMAASKAPIPRRLAAWLRHQAAFPAPEEAELRD